MHSNAKFCYFNYKTKLILSTRYYIKTKYNELIQYDKHVFLNKIHQIVE